MSRPLWFVGLIKKTFPQRFTAARMTRRVPFLGRLAERLLFQGDDIVYLPMDRAVPVGEEVGMPEGTVVPSQVIDYFIDRAPFLWVMDRCICRDAQGCRDYPIDLGCLFMGDAARGINPALGRQVSQEEAREHQRRCREAGLVQLVGRNKLDTFWLGVGPGEKLVTVCNCCPCCCLWKMLPEITPLVSGKVHRMPGVKVEVGEACTGCGRCLEGVCFVGAVRMQGEQAVISEDCRGCGRCATVCPQGAIKVSLPASDAVEKVIERLEPLFDLGQGGTP
jgi:ferredoxin